MTKSILIQRNTISNLRFQGGNSKTELSDFLPDVRDVSSEGDIRIDSVVRNEVVE